MHQSTDSKSSDSRSTDSRSIDSRSTDPGTHIGPHGGRRPDDDTHPYERYFLDTVGLGLQALLAPIPGEVPEGIPAAEDEARYRRIRVARQEEDASLPMGAWERELKRADWNMASGLAARGLAGASKDLQYAAWLLEALIARTGFDALAPGLDLIDALIRQYGERLHPHDPEHRENLLLWIGQKLLPPLRRIPITAAGGPREYAWNDWEHAQRNEQLRSAMGRQGEGEIEGPSLEDVGAALASTAQTRVMHLLQVLNAGLSALQRLQATLDATLGGDAPGFGAMQTLLERVEIALQAETRRRGLPLPGEAEALASADDSDAEVAHHDADGDEADAREHGQAAEAVPLPATLRAVADRRQVYAALAEIAQALERIEPHSPVPYLIRRAVDWGGLNTAQLYNEVFVRCGGQINIFELLGLHPADEDAHAGAG